MSSNMERLGDVLSSRMKRTSAAAIPTTVELGTINSNLSLSTDSLPGTIPRGDYMINLLYTGSEYETGSSTGNDDVEKHRHDLPSVIRPIRAGDRVLVVWCGNEPVVVAIVVGG